MALAAQKGNSFFNNSLFIFITRAFPTLANLVILLYYSHTLPKPVYGLYQSFWIHLYFIYPLACFGIHVLIITYSPSIILKLARSITKTQYLLYLFWVGVVCTLFAWLEYTSKGMDLGFVVPFLFILVFAAGMVLESVIIVFKNMKTMAFINFVYALAFCLIHKQVLQTNFSLNSLFTSLLVLSSLKTLSYLIIVLFRVKLHRDDEDVDSKSTSEIRKLWLHLGFYDILQMAFGGIDKFMISILLSSTLSAIYYNGSQNIPFLPVLLSAAGSAVLIQLIKVKSEDENIALIRMMNQLARILSSIVFPVFFFLVFYSKEIFHFILPEYPDSVPVFVMYLLVLPLKAYSFTTPLQKLHKGAIINIGAIADLVLAIIMIYPLYLWLGLPGVALSFVISTYIQASFYLIYSAKLLGVKAWEMIPWANWVIKLIVFGTIFIGIHYITSHYFDGKIPLILGLSLMVVIIALTVGIELIKERKHGRESSQAEVA